MPDNSEVTPKKGIKSTLIVNEYGNVAYCLRNECVVTCKPRWLPQCMAPESKMFFPCACGTAVSMALATAAAAIGW